MKILNFGSLNIDRTYQVPSFVKAGQTIAASHYQEFLGGKGLNQSIALARAGADVYHVGVIGHDGGELRQALAGDGVDASYLEQVEGHSGHTVIQIDQTGENCIVFEPGSNYQLKESTIDRVLEDFRHEQVLVLTQNEVSRVAYILKRASQEGHIVAFNPSPMDEAVLDMPLDVVDYFLVNETEGQTLTGETSPSSIFKKMQEVYPQANILLTLGDQGALFHAQGQDFKVEAIQTKPVDTTAAGDTFTGYFLAGLTQGLPMQEVLQRATAASSLAISLKGAVDSIPFSLTVEERLKEIMK